MKRVIACVAAVVLGLGSVALGSPGQRTDLGRAAHTEDGTITFKTGQETVALSSTLQPGANSGWHRHPGAVVVLVKSGTLTTFGLDHPPCAGRDVPAGRAYFEDDAANARWPHFVRNRGTAPTEIVVIAFNVGAGASYRTDAPAPSDCPDPK